MSISTKNPVPTTLSEVLEAKVQELLTNIERKNSAAALKSALEIKALSDDCQKAAPYIEKAIKQLEEDTARKEDERKKKVAPPLEKLSFLFGPAQQATTRPAATQTPPQPKAAPAANTAAKSGPTASAAQPVVVPATVVAAPPADPAKPDNNDAKVVKPTLLSRIFTNNGAITEKEGDNK